MMRHRISRREFTKLLIGSGMGVGLLSACGGPAAPAQAPTEAAKAAAPAKAAGKVTLNIWSHFGTGNMGQALTKVAGDFTKANPDIEVNITNVAFGDMWAKVMAATAAGAPPDTFTKAPIFPRELVKEGHVEPVEKYMKWPDDMYPVFDPKIDGVRYGIPIQGAVKVVYYNKDVYSKAGLDPEKPPTIWDDIVTQGKQMTNDAQKQYGIILPTAPIQMLTECWSSFLYSAGGDFLTPDNKEAAFNSDAGVQALQFWVDIFQKHKIAPLVTLDGRSYLDLFSTGSIGMMSDSSVTLGELLAVKFKVGAAPVPPLKQQGSLCSVDFFPFMKASKNKEALAAFFSFFLEPQRVAWWQVSVGGLPSRKSAMQDPIYQDYLQKQPLMKPATQGVEYAKMWPSVVGMESVSQYVAEAGESAIYGRIKPKDALDQAAKKVNDLLKKNA